MMDLSIHNISDFDVSEGKTVFRNDERPLYEIKANLFKGLAHPYRIRVLEILDNNGEVSVADMLTQTGLEASHLSQHLSVLRRYGLVTSDRRGSIVYYALAYSQVGDLLHTARELVSLLTLPGDALAAEAGESSEIEATK